MSKRRVFSEEKKKMIEEARKRNRKKSVEKRLRTLQLYANGEKEKKIAEMTGYSAAYISVIVKKFATGGLKAVAGNHYKGNRRNMSFEEEEERNPSERSLSSYPPVSLCLRRGRAADRRIFLLDFPFMRHRLYESVPERTVQSVPG